MSFDPLRGTNEELRDKFWDKYSEKFISIARAPSSQSLLKGNVRLCNEFLKPPHKTGRILKLDLWDEAHHTATLSHIYQNYDEVHAIDISPDVVKKAMYRLKQSGIEVNGVVGDMRKMPYPDNYFDFNFSMGTIEHIPEPIDAMREIYRVLKPGGKAVVGVPNKYEWFGKSIALNIMAYFGIKEDGKEHSFGWKQLRRDLEGCGFKVIREDGPYFMPWFIRATDWFFAQNMPWASTLLLPVIAFCDYLSRSSFLLRHSGLLAAVVEKPMLDRSMATDLATKFGTPLFVTDKSVILKNVEKFRSGFSNYKGGFTLCYSTKTNSQLSILKTMKDSGVVAEVCSFLDMSSALQAGFTGDQMIYEGLTKTNEELTLAVKSKVKIINIDEAVRLEKIVKDQNHKIDVGLRLAFPSKTGIKSLLGVTYDRFGNSVKMGEAMRVAEFIIHSEYLNLIGLHCHTGSNQMNTVKYLKGVELVVDFMKLLRDKYNVKISIINMGGGVGIPEIVFYTMFDLGKNFIKNMLGKPIVYRFNESFDFASLAQNIVKKLHDTLDMHGLTYPHLMMEPGRFLVGNSTDLILKVLNTKRTDVADWIIVDGGTNLLPVLTLFSEYHRIEMCTNNTEFKKTSIGGPLLYSADIVASNRLMPKASIGDLMIVRAVGAYCAVQSNQFLYPRAATIMVDGDKSHVIQRRETVDDVLQRDMK